MYAIEWAHCSRVQCQAHQTIISHPRKITNLTWDLHSPSSSWQSTSCVDTAVWKVPLLAQSDSVDEMASGLLPVPTATGTPGMEPPIRPGYIPSFMENDRQIMKACVAAALFANSSDRNGVFPL